MGQYYEGENFREELFCKDAEKAAREFIASSNKKPITSAQLRKFYNEFKGLEKKFEKRCGADDDESFKSILPLVKMVKSKVAYASNPKNQKVPAEFKTWLSSHIDSITSARDFRAFMLHFEAVVGFCYGLGLKN